MDHLTIEVEVERENAALSQVIHQVEKWVDDPQIRITVVKVQDSTHLKVSMEGPPLSIHALKQRSYPYPC